MFKDRPPRPGVDPQNYATLCEFRPFAGQFTTNHLGDIDVRDTLKWATAYGQLDVHIYVKSAWSSPNTQDSDDSTPLHTVENKGHLKPRVVRR